MVDFKKVAELEGRDIVEGSGNFYEVLSESKTQGFQLLSPREEMLVRIATKETSKIGYSRESGGNFTTAGIEFLQGYPPIIRLESRLLDLGLAEQAVRANSKPKYFSDSKEVYLETYDLAIREQSLPVFQRKVLFLPSEGKEVIKGPYVLAIWLNFEILEFLARDSELARSFASDYNNGQAIQLFGLHPEEVKKQQGKTLFGQLSIGCWEVYSVMRTDVLLNANNKMRVIKNPLVH